MVVPDSIYMTRVRKRNNASQLFSSSFYVSGSTTRSEWGSLKLTEETRDRENSWWKWNRFVRQQSDPDYRRRLRMYDVGSPFYNKKVYVDMGEANFDLAYTNLSGNLLYRYQGPLIARVTTDSALNAVLATTPLDASLEAGLDAAGTTAIARCAPASPHASAYTAIGELYRDGLPAVPGLKALQGNHSRSSSPLVSSGERGGGEYLNYQFGIVPTISDISDMTKALANASRIYKQYRRDAGRLVRRSYTFPVEEKLVLREVLSSQVPNGGPGCTNNLFWPTRGETVHTVTETTKRWFSGAFTYAHLQDDDLVERMVTQVRQANHLLGVLPTSEALWNLAPWSWAADWVTNIGDVMHNLSMYQSDGLLMRWGYIMEQKIQLHEYVHRGSVARTASGNQPVFLKQRIWQETKRRRPATPFGFGFELDGLSGRQEAILAALALSRGQSLDISR